MTPPGTAIAASLILRVFDGLLPLRAGLAVADVAGDAAEVKWPNDVLLDGLKVAGILVEAQAPAWAVVGIGVNVTATPPEVADIATSLGRDDVEAALGELLEALDARVAQPAAEVVAALRERDALLGRRLRWSGGEGVGAGIDESGSLLVDTGCRDDRAFLGRGASAPSDDRRVGGRVCRCRQVCTPSPRRKRSFQPPTRPPYWRS